MGIPGHVRLLGSSPHSRGARGVGGGCLPTPGIIPAFAGSTLVGKSPSLSPRDHPRIRGEHVFTPPAIIDWTGSSPHSRGAPTLAEITAGTPGIIPAFAGSTSSRPSQQRWHTDHPRIRGEHVDGFDVGVAH